VPHSESELNQKASKRAQDRLEQQVKERTSRLSAINTQLANQIAERERAEIELTLVKDELAADLKTLFVREYSSIASNERSAPNSLNSAIASGN